MALPVAAWLLGGLLGGCGGGEPPAKTAESEDYAEGSPGERRSGLTVQSEVGAIDEVKAQAIMERASGKLTACFTKGTQRIPYLAGAVSVYVRVGGDGSARYAYLRDSTLGDRATEECMLAVLTATQWPKPQGGDEGEVKNEFKFDPGGDERPPVEWTPDQLGKPYERARADLERCRQSAGTGPMKATLYVDTDGKASAVGVSTADEKGAAAVGCVVEAIKSLTFPSPGSYASKVSVIIE
jgi:hypothetical protein